MILQLNKNKENVKSSSLPHRLVHNNNDLSEWRCKGHRDFYFFPASSTSFHTHASPLTVSFCLFLCLISFFLFSCVSTWENTLA